MPKTGEMSEMPEIREMPETAEMSVEIDAL
jgi:hypothetical protein